MRMLSHDQIQRLQGLLPILQTDHALFHDLQTVAFFMRIPAGKDVFTEGSPVEVSALLLSGVVRVYQISDTGREITLYRVNNGESCVLTANAILNHTSFPAIATVEQDAEAVMITANDFLALMRRHETWQRFVFHLMSQRMMQLMSLVDEVVFSRMDTRVAAHLLKLGRQSNPMQITHHDIAVELGSSREVISRLLEDFASRKLIRLSRGVCEIIDFNGLAVRAAVV